MSASACRSASKRAITDFVSMPSLMIFRATLRVTAVNIDPLLPAAMPDRQSAPRTVDQDTADTHGYCRRDSPSPHRWRRTQIRLGRLKAGLMLRESPWRSGERDPGSEPANAAGMERDRAGGGEGPRTEVGGDEPKG